MCYDSLTVFFFSEVNPHNDCRLIKQSILAEGGSDWDSKQTSWLYIIHDGTNSVQ